MPWYELILSVTMQFALGLFTGGGIENHLEELRTDILRGCGTVCNFTAIDIHVFFLTLPQRSVGCQFQRWRWCAAICRAATGGEADHVGTAGDLTGCRDRIVARCVHEYKTLGRHR